MKRTRTLLAALFLLLPALTAVGQTGEDALRFAGRSPAFGARLTGMGGAGLAGVADFSALYSNPAGLAYFTRSSFSGSLQSTGTQDDGLFVLPGFSSEKDQRINATGFGNLAYVHRTPTVRGSMVFGIALTQVNNWNRELRFEGQNSVGSVTDFFMPVPGEFTITDRGNGPDNIPGTDDDYGVAISRDISRIAYETFGIDFSSDLYEAGEQVPFVQAVTRGTIGQAGRVTEEGTNNEISFGGAVEASRSVMVGLSANISYGRYDFNRILTEDDINDENDGTGNTTDFQSLEFGERFESSMVGVNLRAGISGQSRNGLRFGLSVESPTYLTVNEDYSTSLVTRFDNGDSYSYGLDDSDDLGAGTFEYTITTPWRFGAGLAYAAGPLALSADVEFIDWTQLRLSASTDQTYFDDVNLDIRDNYQAAVNTRFGIEYWLGNLALRGGAAYQPDVHRDEVATSAGDDFKRDHTFFSFGMGYRFSREFEVDLGWMQERFKDQYQVYSEVENAPVVDESLLRDRFVIGVRAYF